MAYKSQANYKVQMVRGYPVRTRKVCSEEIITRGRNPIKVGDVINNVTAIEKVGHTIGKCKYEKDRIKRLTLWGCKCNVCGGKVAVGTDVLTHGYIQDCGCTRGKHLFKGEGVSGFNRIFARYVKQAEARNLEWSLARKEFESIVIRPCYYCGDLPSQSNKSEAKRYTNGEVMCNGIDRIDNKKGYISDNVVTCCKLCNFAKRDMDVNEFLKWARAVAANAPKYVF